MKGARHEYSLGSNGLGTCAKQYASEIWMSMSGVMENNTACISKKVKISGTDNRTADRKKTGTTIRWSPTLRYYRHYDSRIVFSRHPPKAGSRQRRRDFSLSQPEGRKIETTDSAIKRYSRLCAEIAGEEPLTQPVFIESERRGRDREDKPEYKLKCRQLSAFHRV